VACPQDARHEDDAIGLSERIERSEDEPLLLLAELDVGHRNGRLTAGEGELDPEVAIDDVARRLVHEDLGHPADRGERSAQRQPLILGMASPVPGVRHELRWRDVGVADDPVAPCGDRRCGQRLRRHHDPGTCIVGRSE
jgi:hypothetical protein